MHAPCRVTCGTLLGTKPAVADVGRVQIEMKEPHGQEVAQCRSVITSGWAWRRIPTEEIRRLRWGTVHSPRGEGERESPCRGLGVMRSGAMAHRARAVAAYCGTTLRAHIPSRSARAAARFIDAPAKCVDASSKLPVHGAFLIWAHEEETRCQIRSTIAQRHRRRRRRPAAPRTGWRARAARTLATNPRRNHGGRGGVV